VDAGSQPVRLLSTLQVTRNCLSTSTRCQQMVMMSILYESPAAQILRCEAFQSILGRWQRHLPFSTGTPIAKPHHPQAISHHNLAPSPSNFALALDFDRAERYLSAELVTGRFRARAPTVISRPRAEEAFIRNLDCPAIPTLQDACRLVP
jgi:hypothetical protein